MRNKRLIFLFLGVFFSMMSYATERDATLQAVTQQQGFFFFYSSSCPHCQRFAPTLKRFSQHYGFSVVAISVDGGFLTEFPGAVMNEGQTKLFQVTVYPSLFLVDPKRQLAHLVTEGNIDENELLSRVLKISQMQDEGSP